MPLTPNNGGQALLACNAGETILGGGCRLMSPDGRIVLSEAGIARQGAISAYQCVFVSTSPVANTGIAEAICLAPAP